MLRKLLKYEFKYNVRIILPIFLAMLVLGAVGGVTLASCLNVLTAASGMLPPFFAIMNGGGIVFGAVMLSVISAVSLVVTLLLVWRFYKSFYSDEAYVTHTLPVTVTQNMWCKTLSGFGWSLASMIVLAASYAIAIFCAVLILGDINKIIPFFNEISELFSAIPQPYASDAVIIGAEWIITGVVSVARTILVCYAIVALGCRAAKKHKVLATVGFYAVYSVGSSIITRLLLSAGISFISMIDINDVALRALLHLSAPVTLLIFVGISTCAWFIIRDCTEKHLNLE